MAVKPVAQSSGSGSGVTVVHHGATASTPRPAGADVVYWVGTVQPTNAVTADLWVRA